MANYTITVAETVIQTVEYVVEADNVEQAIEKIDAGDFYDSWVVDQHVEEASIYNIHSDNEGEEALG